MFVDVLIAEWGGPGVLNDLLSAAICLSVLVVPVLGFVTLVTLIVLARTGKLRGLKMPWTQAGVVCGLLFVTFTLLVFYIPRRMAFTVSRGAFEQMVPHATPKANVPAPLNWVTG